MPVHNIASGASVATGALGADTLFFVQQGSVYLSSDGGTSGIPFHEGSKLIRSSGLNITMQNKTALPVVVVTDPA